MNNLFSKIFKAQFRIPIFIGFLFTAVFLLAFFVGKFGTNFANLLSPLGENDLKKGKEIFGFAPYWTINKLDNVDYNVLTTLAYFGIEIDSDGSLVEDIGRSTFFSSKATEIFRTAHDNGTRVVLTIKQMDNEKIEAFLNDIDAQERAIDETVKAVINRGIDGINVDFEYSGNADPEYKEKFSVFVENLSAKMHSEHPDSHVSVSVYASAGNGKQLYDLTKLSTYTDGIFMMAYDFATAGSNQVIPTSPLYGYKEGRYWYDIATAVDDFLKQMPAEKLILGLPWYGYNYPVSAPAVKASKNNGYYAYAYNRRGYRYKYWVSRSRAHAQTYALAQDEIITEQTGWDEYGQVGWKAYKDEDGMWRMIFLDDVKSLSIKYDFAKQKGLGGVGMWALGFDDGKKEMWALLNEKFGRKFADSRIIKRRIDGI